MDHEDTLRIVSADRFKDYIIIGFSNGRVGRYATALLHDTLPQSGELFEPERSADTVEPNI